MPPTPTLTAAVRRFEAPLTRYATRIVGDRDRARDVVQDTFVRLCEQSSQLDRERLGPWLYAVCHNRAVDLQRRQARLTSLEAAPESRCEAEAERRCQTQELHELVAQLPEAKSRVLALRYAEGCSYRDISDRTGMSVNHVGVMLHQTVRWLRRRAAVVAVLLVAGAMLGDQRGGLPDAGSARLELQARPPALPARSAPGAVDDEQAPAPAPAKPPPLVRSAAQRHASQPPPAQPRLEPRYRPRPPTPSPEDGITTPPPGYKAAPYGR